LSNVTAFSRVDFDRSKSPLFRIALNDSARAENDSNPELLIDGRDESLRTLALKLWDLTSAQGRLPGIKEIFGAKWSHLSDHSMIIDVSGGGSLGSLLDVKLDQVPDALKEMVNEGEIAEGLTELLLPPVSESLETCLPVSFDFCWKTEDASSREFNGAVLPFGNAKVRSVMIVIEELLNPDDVEGAYVLNLDEGSILLDENRDNEQSSGLPGLPVSGLISEAREAAEAARDAAELARSAERKSRHAATEALARSYALAMALAKSPEEIAVQLVFGDNRGPDEIANYVALLRAAREERVAVDDLSNFLDARD